MNREIEFRAWDVENKIMVYDNENDTYGYWDGCQNSDLGMINHLLNRKEYIFMQYTGLKDKNGKKIFEGDIIRLDDEYRRAISSANAKTEEDLVRKDCLVGFKDGSFMFCRNRYIIDDFDSYLWITNKYCEVIGNIYEDNLESKGE